MYVFIYFIYLLVIYIHVFIYILLSFFLCLRTEGAGGIMFPGCPSVRPSKYVIFPH